MFTCSCSIPRYLWPPQSRGLFLFSVNILKIQNVWNSSNTFWFYSAPKRPVLVCTLAQNFFRRSLAKKNQSSKVQIAQPPGQLQLRYLPYLQLCGKASMWIFMCCRCKSGPKLRWNNSNWFLDQGKNISCQHILWQLTIPGI